MLFISNWRKIELKETAILILQLFKVGGLVIMVLANNAKSHANTLRVTRALRLSVYLYFFI
jgi:hypothetical protein